MNRKILATLIVLATTAPVFAQDDTTSTLQNIIALIGPIGTILWLILFSGWGLFRLFR